MRKHVALGLEVLEAQGEPCVLRRRDASKPENARATYPADEPAVEIDFIVTGPADRWGTNVAEVIDESIASDHRPVIAVLEVPTDRIPRP